MSEQNLIRIAIQHFLRFGYEGTKLSHIAQEAGMKKQSLYFHFKDKNDLLMQVNRTVIAAEIDFLQVFFSQNQDSLLQDTLYRLLLGYKQRYLDKDNNGFMFLLTFIPPSFLEDYFNQNYYEFIAHLKQCLQPKFTAEPNLRIDPENGPTSFITLWDGLFTQLIFETARDFDHSLRIFWDIYWHGLIKSQE